MLIYSLDISSASHQHVANTLFKDIIIFIVISLAIWGKNKVKKNSLIAIHVHECQGCT